MNAKYILRWLGDLWWMIRQNIKDGNDWRDYTLNDAEWNYLHRYDNRKVLAQLAYMRQRERVPLRDPFTA